MNKAQDQKYFPATATEVADWFIYACNKEDDGYVSKMKVMKLTYYAHAMCLAALGKPLFASRIEARINGPTVVEIAGNLDEKIQKVGEYDPSTMHEGLDKFLTSVFKIYGKYDGEELSNLTHQEDPWIEARKGLEDMVQSHNEITNQAIQDYYSQMI